MRPDEERLQGIRDLIAREDSKLAPWTLYKIAHAKKENALLILNDPALFKSFCSLNFLGMVDVETTLSRIHDLTTKHDLLLGEITLDACRKICQPSAPPHRFTIIKQLATFQSEPVCSDIVAQITSALEGLFSPEQQNMQLVMQDLKNYYYRPDLTIYKDGLSFKEVLYTAAYFIAYVIADKKELPMFPKIEPWVFRFQKHTPSLFAATVRITKEIVDAQTAVASTIVGIDERIDAAVDNLYGRAATVTGNVAESIQGLLAPKRGDTSQGNKVSTQEYENPLFEDPSASEGNGPQGPGHN